MCLQKHYCDYCDVFLTHDSVSGKFYDGFREDALLTVSQYEKPTTVVVTI